MLTPKPKHIAVVPLYDKDILEMPSGVQLYVPEQAKSRTTQGIVKYIGSDVDRFKPGDHVLFSGYTGTNVDLEGEGRLIFLPAEFVTAVVHDEKQGKVPGLYLLVDKAKSEFIKADYEEVIDLLARFVNKSTPVEPSERLAGNRTGTRNHDLINDAPIENHFDNEDDD